LLGARGERNGFAVRQWKCRKSLHRKIESFAAGNEHGLIFCFYNDLKFKGYFLNPGVVFQSDQWALYDLGHAPGRRTF
jgi:hypothetical protein